MPSHPEPEESRHRIDCLEPAYLESLRRPPSAGRRPTAPRRLSTTRSEDNAEGPPVSRGPFDIVPGEALAEDTRFELVRGCPQHAFQLCVWLFGVVREHSRCRSGAVRAQRWTAATTSELDKDQDNEPHPGGGAVGANVRCRGYRRQRSR
jgi:hypothetical protein